MVLPPNRRSASGQNRQYGGACSSAPGQSRLFTAKRPSASKSRRESAARVATRVTLSQKRMPAHSRWVAVVASRERDENVRNRSSQTLPVSESARTAGLQDHRAASQNPSAG